MTAEEILEKNFGHAWGTLPHLTLALILNAIAEFSSQENATLTSEVERLKKEIIGLENDEKDTNVICKKILDGKGLIYIRNLESEVQRLNLDVEQYMAACQTRESNSNYWKKMYDEAILALPFAPKKKYMQETMSEIEYYQPLFNLMYNEHQLTLIQSELDDIIYTVHHLSDTM